jgi:hypothetical protein
MKGVDVGHATWPAERMQAENPVGGEPPQTASALANGTSQKRCVGSVSCPAFACAVPVQAPALGGSGVAWKLPSVAWSAA